MKGNFLGSSGSHSMPISLPNFLSLPNHSFYNLSMFHLKCLMMVMPWSSVQPMSSIISCTFSSYRFSMLSTVYTTNAFLYRVTTLHTYLLLLVIIRLLIVVVIGVGSLFLLLLLVRPLVLVALRAMVGVLRIHTLINDYSSPFIL
jgi:hypothetical protein